MSQNTPVNIPPIVDEIVRRVRAAYPQMDRADEAEIRELYSRTPFAAGTLESKHDFFFDHARVFVEIVKADWNGHEDGHRLRVWAIPSYSEETFTGWPRKPLPPVAAPAPQGSVDMMGGEPLTDASACLTHCFRCVTKIEAFGQDPEVTKIQATLLRRALTALEAFTQPAATKETV